jgi:pheromone a factor receptor
MMSTDGGATLPVFIHNHTIRKVDDLDSISDMSISSQDIGGDEKDKTFSPDLSYGAISLADVGGTLADYKAEPYSPTPTSGASSASSLDPIALSPTAVPFTSPSRPNSSIEISSIHYVDGNERPVSIAVPEFKLEVTSASRHATDTSGVHEKPHDMV